MWVYIGIRSVQGDVIWGLKKQTRKKSEDYENTIKRAVALL